MKLPGSWTIGRLFGVPIRIHWSVPVYALLAGGARIAPGAWLAAVLLVLIHELGHALVVKWVGARATAVDVFGFGGLCWWKGSVTPVERACIAWGGIWAQLVVFAVAGTCVLVLGMPKHLFAADMVGVALSSNLWLIGFNLLPIAPLDGKEAWPLFSLLWRSYRERRAPRPLRDVPSSFLDDLARARPPRPAVPDSKRRVVAAVPFERSRIDEPRKTDVDDLDEADFTPEVAEVLDRVRAIVAREASRDPEAPDKDGADKSVPSSRDKSKPS